MDDALVQVRSSADSRAATRRLLLQIALTCRSNGTGQAQGGARVLAEKLGNQDRGSWIEQPRRGDDAIDHK